MYYFNNVITKNSFPEETTDLLKTFNPTIAPKASIKQRAKQINIPGCSSSSAIIEKYWMLRTM